MRGTCIRFDSRKTNTQKKKIQYHSNVLYITVQITFNVCDAGSKSVLYVIGFFTHNVMKFRNHGFGLHLCIYPGCTLKDKSCDFTFFCRKKKQLHEVTWFRVTEFHCKLMLLLTFKWACQKCRITMEPDCKKWRHFIKLEITRITGFYFWCAKITIYFISLPFFLIFFYN